jgi:hypothetical protein
MRFNPAPPTYEGTTAIYILVYRINNQFCWHLPASSNSSHSSGNFAFLGSLESFITGEFLFAETPAVPNFNGFPVLSQIGGSLDLTGNFNSVELPNLNSIGGGVNVQSSSPSFQCIFPNFRTNRVVRGK